MCPRRIFKSGDGLAIILPAAFCRDLKIKRGDYVNASIGPLGILIQSYGLTTVSQGAEHGARNSGKPLGDAQRA